MQQLSFYWKELNSAFFKEDSLIRLKWDKYGELKRGECIYNNNNNDPIIEVTDIAKRNPVSYTTHRERDPVIETRHRVSFGDERGCGGVALRENLAQSVH